MKNDTVSTTENTTEINDQPEASPKPEGKSTARKPLFIAAAALLAAAAVCGIIWHTALKKADGSDGSGTITFALAGTLDKDAASFGEIDKDPDDVSGANYEYEENKDGTLTLTRYRGENTAPTVPSEINGKKVTALSNTFSLSDITSVYIPESVTDIGDRVFFGCGRLDSVIVHGGLTSIGSWAFYDCDSLVKVTIPDGVTSIGDGAFYECGSLRSVTIPDSVTGIGVGAFRECGRLRSVTIPDSVTDISDSIFFGCTGLDSVTIPDSVTSIGERAFYYCDSLVSVTIPDSVTGIGDNAFSYCDSLASVTIPGGVTSIGDVRSSRSVIWINHGIINCKKILRQNYRSIYLIISELSASVRKL